MPSGAGALVRPLCEIASFNGLDGIDLIHAIKLEAACRCLACAQHSDRERGQRVPPFSWCSGSRGGVYLFALRPVVSLSRKRVNR